MSITIDYFFNADDPLAAVGWKINQTLGCSLAPYDSDPEYLFCKFLGMEFSLDGDHGLERDRNLNFPEYRYVIGTRTPVPDGDLRPIQLEVMAVTAFVLHQRLAIHGGMLVFDGQRLLARYELHDAEWIDQVSGRAVRFPEHLLDLRAQLPPRNVPPA